VKTSGDAEFGAKSSNDLGGLNKATPNRFEYLQYSTAKDVNIKYRTPGGESKSYTHTRTRDDIERNVLHELAHVLLLAAEGYGPVPPNEPTDSVMRAGLEKNRNLDRIPPNRWTPLATQLGADINGQLGKACSLSLEVMR
jgi:hypothetical protein